MANKADKFYFDCFIAAGESSAKAAAFLSDCLKNYKPDEIGTSLFKLHEIEHAADLKKHEVSNALAKAFVTPVDREDLALISESIDNVTDSIEEVLQQIYVDQIKTVLPEAIEFSDMLVHCCSLMTNMLRELVNFKKPARLLELIIELNHAEEKCDELYLRALLSVRTHCTDVLDIMFWREIYNCMENCADACENVGDCIATIVMKNT